MSSPDKNYQIKISKAHHDDSMRDSGMSFGGNSQ